MNIKVALDNFAKFFDDENVTSAQVPAEVFRDEYGKVIEIRIYNSEYEQMIVLDRSGNVEAISVEEYEAAVKFS